MRKKVKGSNNKINLNGAFLKRVSLDICGDNNTVTVGRLTRIRDCIIIIHGSDHTLTIDDNCFINNSRITFVQDSGIIKIGKGTTIGQAAMLAGESKTIEIGQDCMFSSEIEIRTTDSHSIISLETQQKINPGESVKVGNHVWIGNGCKLWKGAHVGDNSVVGAFSMVSKQIPNNCIAVGIPAKVTKENVTWDRKLFL